MGIEPLLFGVALAVTLWLSSRSGDRDVRGLALVLVLLWALMNTAWLLDALWVFPLLDLCAGIFALRVWRNRHTFWASAVVNTSFIRLELHLLDSLTGHAFIVPYLHALNATFVWMLLAVAFPGGGHVFNRIGRGMRHRVRALLPAYRQAAS